MCTYEGGVEISTNNEPLKIRFNHDYSEGYLTQDFHCLWENDEIVIPENFITDFASVPRWAWSFTPPFGQHTPAAVVHDWLYVSKPFIRETCDRIFCELMKKLGVGWWRRNVMYYAVRIGGSGSWRYDTLIEAHFKNFGDDTTHLIL